jgi:phage-related protein (TIGR01555 family)
MNWPFGKKTPASRPTPLVLAPETKRRRIISSGAMSALDEAVGAPAYELTPMPPVPRPSNPFMTAPAPKAVMAMDGYHDPRIAMDDAAWGKTWGEAAAWKEGIGFLGYPYLAELSQRPEYRKISEIIAEEMTRKWGHLTYGGKSRGDAGAKKIERLAKTVEQLEMRERFRDAVLQDGFFGRSQVFVDVGNRDDREELRKPLVIAPEKIGKSLKGFTTVEPVWSYPLRYDSTNPLAPNFYKPEEWAVQDKAVHASRLMTVIGRPMPDLLKPAYAFGGLSLSQMAKPYVDNWLRTRQSVSDLIHSFSVMILSTDMGDELDAAGMGELIKRVQLAIKFRDNRGVQVADKESEEWDNIAVPLGTLDALQAQAQEQMCSIAAIPTVKLLGIQPAGLNASSDGEIRVFYDHIHASQERLLGHHVRKAIKVAQLYEFGSIDEAIGWDFDSLWELDEAGEASVRKTDADTAAVLIESGVIDPEEERERQANSPTSLYQNVDLSGPAPEPPEDDGGLGEAGGDPAKTAEPRKEARSGV